MTEEEAKTKWCPMVRQTSESDNYKPATNRFEIADVSAFNCIGSACMARRKNYTIPVHVSGQLLSEAPRGALMVEDGHCGLAGKP